MTVVFRTNGFELLGAFVQLDLIENDMTIRRIFVPIQNHSEIIGRLSLGVKVEAWTDCLSILGVLWLPNLCAGTSGRSLFPCL